MWIRTAVVGTALIILGLLHVLRNGLWMTLAGVALLLVSAVSFVRRRPEGSRQRR